jgi:hypothetical protein
MMVEADALAEMAKVVGARLRISAEVRPAALRASVREAEHLAANASEAAPALVYALARNPSAFRAFGAMIVAAAHLQSRISGVRISARPQVIADLARRTRDGEKTYEEVRAFFAEASLPFGG